MICMDELVLSREDFKAFSSDTRAKIAKMLKERNYTLSELSKKLGMASPTVKTHLDKLAGASIVEQHDEGRKWKYYALTRKGRKLLEPEGHPAIMVVIGITALLLVGTIFFISQDFSLIGSSTTALKTQSVLQGSTSIGVGSEAQAPATTVDTEPKAGSASGTAGLVFLAMLLAFVLGYFIARQRFAKGKQW